MDDKVNHLKWILSDLIVDLTINTEVFREFISDDDFSEDNPASNAKIRMVCSSLIINLSKLWETLKHFGETINNSEESLRLDCMAIKSEIERKKIYQFRSKYVAHVKDKETGQPLSLIEGKRRIDDIFGSTIDELNNFCNWVCPEPSKDKAGGVVHIIQQLRDYCKNVLGGEGERP